MPSTRIPGITVNAACDRTIDKEHRGVRIHVRLGPISEDGAEARLNAEVERVELELQRKPNARPTFADGAARYLKESRDKRTVDVTAWHVRLLSADSDPRHSRAGPVAQETPQHRDRSRDGCRSLEFRPDRPCRSPALARKWSTRRQARTRLRRTQIAAARLLVTSSARRSTV